MMIRLFGRDEYSVLGIAAILDGEKIPYQRVERLQPDGETLLLVATSDLSSAETMALSETPTIVISGGPAFARLAFGVADAGVTTRRCSIDLDAPIWPPATTRLARSFEKQALHLGAAPVCTGTHLTRGTPLAWLSASALPAIVGGHQLLWSTIDLGAVFASLLTERDLPARSQRRNPSRSAQWLRYAAESAYYAAPETARRWVQSRAYAKLARRLQADPEGGTEYPIDATGWLLIELVKALIKLASGSLVRLERWPAPFRAAATLTHDLEPQPFAYRAGLDGLLDRAALSGHAATFGLVAQASERYLPETTVPQLRGHGVLCHGLTHRGDAVRGQVRVSHELREARRRLQQRLHRPVVGYRSPRLDRSADLLWALDSEGFHFDSSYPDVDRENLHHYGGGVRLNIPFRPLLVDAPLQCRPSRCLELPLTAPDCIQPLFAGASLTQLRTTVATKAAFVRDTNGLYVALVHAGVFGARDAALREEHLDFVHRQLAHPDVWLAAIEEIAEWWWAREALGVTAKNGVVHLINDGPRAIAGVRLIVETAAGEKSFPIPVLAPGARTAVTVMGRTATVDDMPQATAPRLRAVR